MFINLIKRNKKNKKNAPANIKEILPNDWGEMEFGHDTDGNKFYFLMIDPEIENEKQM